MTAPHDAEDRGQQGDLTACLTLFLLLLFWSRFLGSICPKAGAVWADWARATYPTYALALPQGFGPDTLQTTHPRGDMDTDQQKQRVLVVADGKRDGKIHIQAIQA